MIPNYETIMLPLLKFVSQDTVRVRDAVVSLADEFKLTDSEREHELPSGKTKKFASRVHWAATYLVQAALLERPQRGFLQITDRGTEVLKTPPDQLDNKFLARYEEFLAFKKRSKPANDMPEASPPADEANEEAPEERIESAFAEITAALRSDLLTRIQTAPPEFFEQLIVDLMIAMGYGEGGGGKKLGRTNDGGIDGIITEDALGLDVVYLQAKRYQTGSVIGIEKIQAFTGALVGQGANKGVFVTTSHYSPQAIGYASKTPQRLILIDGERLTKLMVQYQVGVRVQRDFKIMRLDTDYFIDDE